MSKQIRVDFFANLRFETWFAILRTTFVGL